MLFNYSLVAEHFELCQLAERYVKLFHPKAEIEPLFKFHSKMVGYDSNSIPLKVAEKDFSLL